MTVAGFVDMFGEEEDFSQYEEPISTGFKCFPHGTKVLCRVTEVEAAMSQKGQPYDKLTLKVISYPSDLSGYPKGKLWASGMLTLPFPKARMEGQPDEKIKDWKRSVGLFRHRCRAFGLDPGSMVPEDYDADSYGEMLNHILGRKVIADLKLDKAGREYRGKDGETRTTTKDKNLVAEFLPATDANLEEFKLLDIGADNEFVFA